MNFKAQRYLKIFNLANQQLVYLSTVVDEELDVNFDIRLGRNNASLRLKASNNDILLVFFFPLKLRRDVSIIPEYD